MDKNKMNDLLLNQHVATKEKNIEEMSQSEINKLFHELQLKKIRLEMQNIELERDKEFFQKLMEKSIDGIYTLDIHGNFSYVSPSGEEITGYRIEELKKMNFYDFVPRSEMKIIDELWGTLMKGDKLQNLEIKLPRKDGTVKVIEVNVTPLFENEKVVGAVGVARDISKRKQAEGKLRISDKELRIRNLISDIFLKVPDDEMYTRVLRVVLDALESPYGIFGYIAENGDLIVPTMTRTIWDKCQVPDKTITFPQSDWGNSSWVRAIREKRVVYSNKSATNIPEGHIAITRNLAVPLIYQGEVIGLLQVANKNTDYNENDVQLLKIIGDAIAPILDARLRREWQTQKLELYRDRLEKLVKERTSELEKGNKQLKQEITVRKKTEKALRESKEQLFQFFDALPLAVFIVDANGKPYFANDSAKKLLGKGIMPAISAELLSEVYQAYFAGTDQQYLLKKMPIYRALSGEFSTIDDMEIHHPDRIIPIQVWGAPIFDSNKQVKYAVAAFADTTERKKAEREILTHQKHLLSMFDGIEEVLYVADPETHELLYVNETFKKGWGSDVIGKVCYKVLQNLDAPCSFCTNHIIFNEKPGQAHIWEFQNINTRHWYRCFDKAIKWSDGRMVRFEMATDITEMKQTLVDLEKAKTELEYSNKELEQFAYVASHDLQEPLRMVASYTQLLAKRYGDKLDNDAHDFINFAVDGAKRMQTLINDLLAFSRLGTRKKPFCRIDLNEVVSQVLKNLEFSIKESNAIISVDTLPEISCDKTQLEQVFQNLISNAIKFRGDKKPEITIDVIESGTNWQISVRDNGIGFNPDYSEKIFIIFQRLHGKDKYTGTGIGLALCRKIVERHGGKIWTESAQGEGSTFYFTLPIDLTRTL